MSKITKNKGRAECNITYETLNAFRKDVENFLRQFEQQKDLTYITFASLWRKNYFNFIFAKYNNASDIALFLEYHFRQIKPLLTSSHTLAVRVCALYLLYGLYYKQPLRKLVQVRVTLNEYKQMKSIVETSTSQGNNDPLTILIKLHKDALIFTILPYVMAPEFIPLEILLCTPDTNSTLIQSDDVAKLRTSCDRLQSIDKKYTEALSKCAEKHKGVKVREGNLDKANKRLLEVIGQSVVKPEPD